MLVNIEWSDGTIEEMDFPEYMIKGLQKLADMRGISIDEAFTEAITDGIKRFKEQQKQLK